MQVFPFFTLFVPCLWKSRRDVDIELEVNYDWAAKLNSTGFVETSLLRIVFQNPAQNPTKRKHRPGETVRT